MTEKISKPRSDSSLYDDIDMNKVLENVARLDQVKQDMSDHPAILLASELASEIDLLDPTFSSTEFIEMLENVDGIGSLTQDQKTIIKLMLCQRMFVLDEALSTPPERDRMQIHPSSRRLNIHFR